MEGKVKGGKGRFFRVRITGKQEDPQRGGMLNAIGVNLHTNQTVSLAPTTRVEKARPVAESLSTLQLIKRAITGRDVE